MGVVASIDAERFPKQGFYLGKRVRVCFKYDLSKIIEGVIVRDDVEAPGMTIIRLDDGRYVLAAECQYSLPTEGTVTDEACPARTNSPGIQPRALAQHCWHDNGVMKPNIPGLYVQRCCWCNAERTRGSGTNEKTPHGPHRPPRAQ